MAKPNGLDRSPIHLLHRASQCAGEIFDAEVGEDSLTARQLAVLVTIANHDGLSQTGVVDRTGIDGSTLAELVVRLQKRGLLQRRRTKHDARAYALKLTDEGHRLVAKAEPRAKRADDRLLAALPDGQRAQFVNRLASIVEKLQAVTSPDS